MNREADGLASVDVSDSSRPRNVSNEFPNNSPHPHKRFWTGGYDRVVVSLREDKGEGVPIWPSLRACIRRDLDYVRASAARAAYRER